MKNLKKVLESHKKWLDGEKDGIRANLRGVNLSNIDLSYVDLSFADLSYANLSNANLSNTDLNYANLSYAVLINTNLSNANLSEANLSEANLSNSNLSNVDLRGANLSYTNLSYVDLRDANLRDVDLIYADLSYTDLSNTDLRGANLRGANLNHTDLRNVNLREVSLSNAYLKDIKYNYLSIGLNLVCPEEGSYIGYKKAKNKQKEVVIVKILITEDSLRSSATSRKCRCSKAKVLNITSLDGAKSFDEAYSNWDKTFVYRVGEIVAVDDFNTNRWEECSTGIHHFITRKEAVEYQQI